MKVNWGDIGTGILVLCAMTVTGMAISNRLHARAPAPVVSPSSIVQDTTGLTAGARTLGASGPIRIVEFADYQCPSCAAFHRTLERVVGRPEANVRAAYRNVPLSEIHPHALAAATAAECAGDQGRFEEMHAELFQAQDSIGHRQWNDFRVLAGVKDSARFAQCMTSAMTAGRISHDKSLGVRAGVFGTPAIVIDGRLYHGNMSEAQLVTLLNASRAAH